LVRDPKKGPGNATIFTRVARYQTPKETQDRTRLLGLVEVVSFSLMLGLSVLLDCFHRRSSSVDDASNVQRLGGRRDRWACGQTRGYGTAAGCYAYEQTRIEQRQSQGNRTWWRHSISCADPRAIVFLGAPKRLDSKFLRSIKSPYLYRSWRTHHQSLNK
jgi:hypothetical protein